MTRSTVTVTDLFCGAGGSSLGASQAGAECSWRRHKAPMAAYWKAVSVYAGHLARALRRPGATDEEVS